MRTARGAAIRPSDGTSRYRSGRATLTRTGVPALRTKDADAARPELSDLGAGRRDRVLSPNEDVHSRDGGEDHRRDAHTEKEAHGQQF
jgi:hypothetical protein